MYPFSYFLFLGTVRIIFYKKYIYITFVLRRRRGEGRGGKEKPPALHLVKFMEAKLIDSSNPLELSFPYYLIFNGPYSCVHI